MNGETIYDSMQIIVGAEAGVFGQSPMEISTRWNDLWKPLHPNGQTDELQCMIMKSDEETYHFTVQKYFDVPEMYPYLDEVADQVERNHPEVKAVCSPKLLGGKTGILLEIPVAADANRDTITDSINELVSAVRYMESYIEQWLPKFTVNIEHTANDGFILSDGNATIKMTAHDAQRFCEVYAKSVLLRGRLDAELERMVDDCELPATALSNEVYKKALLYDFIRSMMAGTEEEESLDDAFEHISYEEYSQETQYLVMSFYDDTFRGLAAESLVEGWSAAADWAHQALMDGHCVEICEKGAIYGLQIKADDYRQIFEEQDIAEFHYKPEDVCGKPERKDIERE